MAEPLARNDLLVWIFYGMFGFRDRWCDADDGGESITASLRTVVGASTYRVAAQALSRRARLTVRLWPGPPPHEAGWDGAHEMELHCPTGEMVADEITGGSPEVIDLGEPGVYGLRASWRGREAVEIGLDDAAAERAWGEEQFLFDMWRTGPLPPDDDDEEFEEELAHWR
ncbi:hypothetical protein [Actinoplanes sp. NPDC049316]|uniref:hypothetical protein n=1 Tax=Actinoplanes sp. NPDC049316 TaxID=3154727 RepID=UPI00341B7D7E